MNQQLKPCPFCGTAASVRHYAYSMSPQLNTMTKYQAFCHRRQCAIPIGHWFDSLQEAAQEWNQRTERPSNRMIAACMEVESLAASEEWNARAIGNREQELYWNGEASAASKILKVIR